MTLAALPILLATSRFLVIDKPAGLAVHPGPATQHSLEALLPLLVSGNRPPPVPVHRLDRDTSGCLLLARNRAALRALSAAFAAGQIAKTYHAIIANPPAENAGEIDAPLAKRSSRAAGWRMVVDPNGKPARTRWTVLARAGGLALLRFHPLTGRTHQLRVHATLLADGAYIIGDPVYDQTGNGQPPELSAQSVSMMLHASEVALVDPWSDPANTATARAPCPGRFRALGFSF